MSWFNYYGLVIVAIIMIPNIILVFTSKNSFKNNYQNKYVEILEQIGRFGCILFMIFNIPYTCFNFWFNNAFIVYLSVNGCLCFIYCILWIILWKRNNILKSLALSIIPTFIFLFSGIMILNIPLILLSVLFGINHILLSYKNATMIKKDHLS